jgi:hypothetical protein
MLEYFPVLGGSQNEGQISTGYQPSYILPYPPVLKKIKELELLGTYGSETM